MIAIVTAGGEIQPDEPLYAVTQGGLKAMVDINGKPMVQWVLDALCASNQVDGVVVVGLPPETNLDCACPLYLLPDQGDRLSNIRMAARECLKIDPSSAYAILAAGDDPALRSEIVDWLTCQAQDYDQDIYLTLLERTSLETEFPDSRRAYMHLKNMQICNGDLHCFRLETALQDRPFWAPLVSSGKNPFRQASILGYDTLLFLTLRQLTLKDAEATVNKRLGIKSRLIMSPYPEIGMKIDKPAHLEFMRDYLARRHARTTADPQSD